MPLGQFRGLPLPLLPGGPKPGEAGHAFAGMVRSRSASRALPPGGQNASPAGSAVAENAARGSDRDTEGNGRGRLPLPLYFLPSWEDPRPAVRCRRPDAGEERPGVVREIPPVPAFR